MTKIRAQKQMYLLFVLLNVKSCHLNSPPRDLTFSTRINKRCLLHHPPKGIKEINAFTLTETSRN